MIPRSLNVVSYSKYDSVFYLAIVELLEEFFWKKHIEILKFYDFSYSY